jgi:hypothetical protein
VQHAFGEGFFSGFNQQGEVDGAGAFAIKFF